MTILVDEDGCIACGQCMEICPEVFKPRPDGKAYAAAEDLSLIHISEPTRPY